MATISSVLVARRMAALASNEEAAGASERPGWTPLPRRSAEAERERAEQHLYIARIGQAEGALRLFDAATARGLLDQCRPGPGEPDRRGWEWSYLDQWCRPELSTMALPDQARAHCCRREPRRPPAGGRLLAPQAVNAGTIPARPGLPDQPARWPGPARARRALRFVLAVAFRPDGKRLATLGAQRERSGSGTPAAVGLLRTISLGSTEWRSDPAWAKLEPGRPTARQHHVGRHRPDLGSRDGT